MRVEKNNCYIKNFKGLPQLVHDVTLKRAYRSVIFKLSFLIDFKYDA